MRICLARQALAVILAATLVFSSTIWAGAEFTGSLRTSGIVLTNSIPLPDGATVRSGDHISTQPGALAVITSSRGRIEVRAGSAARLGADRIQLEQGSVAAARLAVEVDGYTIRPQGPERSWFAVARRDGRLVVAAHRGNLLIASAGAPAVLVSEGSFATRDTPPDKSKEDQEKEKRQEQEKEKKRRRTAAAGAATGGWTIGGLSHAASVALVVGVGAGVAAAAAGLAVALSDETPSPSQ